MLQAIKRKRIEDYRKGRRASLAGTPVALDADGKMKAPESATAIKSFERMVLKFPKILAAFLKIKRVFKKFDADNSGTIEVGELKDCLHALHAKVSDEDVKEIFEEVDMEKTKALTFNEFLLMLCIGGLLKFLPMLEVDVDTAEAAGAAGEGGGAGAGAGEGKEGKEAAGGAAEGKDAAAEGAAVLEEGAKALVEALQIAVEAYLLFDADASGTIDREEVMAMMEEAGSSAHAKHKKGGGGHMNALLSKERWGEMDWDHDGTITFKEFVFALMKWVGLDDEDTDEDA